MLGGRRFLTKCDRPSEKGKIGLMRVRSSDISEAPAIGHAIDIDTKSYDRIFGMLLGIRLHVSRISAQPIVPLRGSHFDEYEKIDIPREGNHTSPAHRGRYDYKFKTYAPVVFMHLRHFFGITDDEYLVSITADYMMSELKTIGRSSAMFYYTWDGRYILKTLTKGELNCLRKMLPRYYQHVTNHPDTLVNQFFGAYRSQTSMGHPIRFVIMNNVFPIGFQIHYKFDLKGSVVNRSVSEEKRKHPGSTWKEAEFQEKRYLHIGPRDWNLLRAQLLDDTNFLSSVGVMDYSLMVGVHQFNPDSPIMHPPRGERIEILSVFTPDQSSRSRYVGNSVIVRKMELKGGNKKKKKKIGPTEKTKLDFGAEKPFAAVMPRYVSDDNQKLLSFCGGLRGTNEMDEPISEIYFMGIIDFLQYYNQSKKTEHFFKKAVYKKDAMSCIKPAKYANRMYDFLCRTMGPAEEITAERQAMLERRRERLTEMARPRPPELGHDRDVQLDSGEMMMDKKAKKEWKKEQKLLKKQAKKGKKEEKKAKKEGKFVPERRHVERRAVHHHSVNLTAMRGGLGMDGDSVAKFRVRTPVDHPPTRPPLPRGGRGSPRYTQAPGSLNRLTTPLELLNSGESLSVTAKMPTMVQGEESSGRASLTSTQPITTMPSMIGPEIGTISEDSSSSSEKEPEPPVEEKKIEKSSEKESEKASEKEEKESEKASEKESSMSSEKEESSKSSDSEREESAESSDQEKDEESSARSDAESESSASSSSSSTESSASS